LTGSPDSTGASPVSLQTAPSLDVAVKWTDELRIYGEGFVGRREELAALDQAWAEGARIFALHAEGGAGKTRVVVEWLRRMRDDGWRGARRVFVHSFYSQGSDERRNASSELFFEQALAFFGYRGGPLTQADERGRMLVRLLGEQRGLLVLDGLEPLQHPTQHAERGLLKDPGIARLLLSLANIPRSEARGLCLITSRQPVIELQAREGATIVQQSLEHLHRDDGAELLRKFEVAGRDEELRQASDEFHGHAYSLMLLGSYLKNATEHHDICHRGEFVLLDEDAEQGGHARKMFAAYVRHLGEDSSEVAVLRLLGFFDRAAEQQLLDVLRAREGMIYEWPKEGEPAEKQLQSRRIEDSLADVTAPLLGLGRTLPKRTWIERLLYPFRRLLRVRNSARPMPEDDWYRVLNHLRDLRLIDFTRPSKLPAVGAHPLLRECFAEQVRAQFPKAWRAGHRRLFEHLSGSVPYWPDGIEGLKPLYQAVTHCCRAGLHEQACTDLFRERILRGTGREGFYSSRRLGAMGADLGAVACFFTTPWTVITPDLAPSDQDWLLNEAGYCLRALGRLAEAAEPMRLAVVKAVEQHDWINAALYSGNLSELELTRGEIPAAVEAGEQAVIYADQSGYSKQCFTTRTKLADALHQAGCRAESLHLFEDAESRQAKRWPKSPLLFSVRGFRYCDLLLSEVERAAWKNHVTHAACDSARERANKALQKAIESGHLLDIALNRLTLVRAAWYAGPGPGFDNITSVVNDLRDAGEVEYIGRGLLTRAWIRCLSGDDPGSREDLDEAWEIAERGPMPLFQADIHLYLARLFRDRAALAEARRLIEKHGYHRRDGELADAEAAAERW
jgi:tetratricopeptide (TPR) repeat protein